MDVMVCKTKIGLEARRFSQMNFLLLSSCICGTTFFSLHVTFRLQTAQLKTTVFLGVTWKVFSDRPNLSLC